MSDSSNISQSPTKTLTSGTYIPVQTETYDCGKTTMDAIASYVASSTKPITGGSFSGTLTGVTSSLFTPSVMTISDNIGTTSYVQLNHATVKIAASVVPTEGRLLIISQKDAGTVGHTLTTMGTFDGTNNTATFNAANEALVLFGVSSTRWIIIANVGSVALSAVA